MSLTEQDIATLAILTEDIANKRFKIAGLRQVDLKQRYPELDDVGIRRLTMFETIREALLREQRHQTQVLRDFQK